MEIKIIQGNWIFEDNNDGGKFIYSKRSGNVIEEIDFAREDFLDLYNLVVALGQLRPDWLQ
jgi:hypothetical protein